MEPKTRTSQFSGLVLPANLNLKHQVPSLAAFAVLVAFLTNSVLYGAPWLSAPVVGAAWSIFLVFGVMRLKKPFLRFRFADVFAGIIYTVSIFGMAFGVAEIGSVVGGTAKIDDKPAVAASIASPTPTASPSSDDATPPVAPPFFQSWTK